MKSHDAGGKIFVPKLAPQAVEKAGGGMKIYDRKIPTMPRNVLAKAMSKDKFVKPAQIRSATKVF